VDVIQQVGPGGHYLSQEHTRRHFRAETWFPTLIDRQMRRAWEAGGSQTMADRIRAQVVDILEHHQPAPLPDGTEQALREIVARAEARHSV
jgi:trimethylamine--corrinoid protein Co-methyltransferase